MSVKTVLQIPSVWTQSECMYEESEMWKMRAGGNVGAKQCNVSTAKARTAPGLTNVQFANKRRNKGKHYGTNYSTSTHRDDNIAWNITEPPLQE